MGHCLGIGLGLGIQPSNNAVIASGDFTSGAVGVATLPVGFSFSRASSATTADYYGKTLVVTGITTDVPRRGKSANQRTGLRFEKSATNIAKQCNDPSNNTNYTTFGTVTITHPYVVERPGPDGSLTTPTRVQTPAGTHVRYQPLVGNSGPWTYSAWMRAQAAGDSCVFGMSIAAGAYIGTPSVGDASAADDTWSYRSVSSPGGDTAMAFVISDSRGDSTYLPGPAAAARDTVIDFVQAETGLFPTSSIVTTTATVTRAGERLWLPAASTVVQLGRIGFYVALEPGGANTAMGSTTLSLWYIDGNNYGAITPTTGIVKVVINGAIFNCTTALTWSAGDLVEIWCEAGGGSLLTIVKARVNSGAAVTLGTSGAAQDAIVPGANTLDLLCVSTTLQLSALVQRIDFYAHGQRPAWAA